MAVIPAHFRYSVSTQQAQRLAPAARVKVHKCIVTGGALPTAQTLLRGKNISSTSHQPLPGISEQRLPTSFLHPATDI